MPIGAQEGNGQLTPSSALISSTSVDVLARHVELLGELRSITNTGMGRCYRASAPVNEGVG